MTQGLVNVPDLAVGRPIDNDAVTIPAGTVLRNSDGTTTTLSSPAVYFRQRVVNADPTNPVGLASVTGGIGPNPGEFGVSTWLVPGQADLQTIAALLLDIDSNIAQLAGNPPLANAFPAPTPQYALPVAGMPPGQLSPTVPRGVICDQFGRQIVLPYGDRNALAATNITITSTTAAQTLIAAGGDANIYNDIVALTAGNTSATGTELTISDGTQSMTLYVPATEIRGISLGGVIIPATKTNTAWTATTVTSVASVKVWVLYVKTRAS